MVVRAGSGSAGFHQAEAEYRLGGERSSMSMSRGCPWCMLWWVVLFVGLWPPGSLPSLT